MGLEAGTRDAQLIVINILRIKTNYQVKRAKRNVR